MSYHCERCGKEIDEQQIYSFGKLCTACVRQGKRLIKTGDYQAALKHYREMLERKIIAKDIFYYYSIGGTFSCKFYFTPALSDKIFIQFFKLR